MSELRRCLRLHIRGRVQGVWFRGATQEQARLLGIDGWVRNCADGSVEALLEGPAAAVDRMAAWCGHGPSQARVIEVEAMEEPPSGVLGFHIRR
jgi:acylphosphatase